MQLFWSVEATYNAFVILARHAEAVVVVFGSCLCLSTASVVDFAFFACLQYHSMLYLFHASSIRLSAVWTLLASRALCKCVALLLTHAPPTALEVEGIFRVSGSVDEIKKLKRRYDRGMFWLSDLAVEPLRICAAFAFTPSPVSSFVVSCLRWFLA